MRSLNNAVVVITGASSGIGKATALAFARRGARLVLGARRAEPLEATAHECRQLGAAALAVPTDVTDEVAVQALAQAAIDAHGVVDVWFNNVGTGVFGPYWEAPVELQRKVIEANLIGTLHGASAVLPHFLKQRRGVLVNMCSMGGWSPTPFAASYAASKYGIRGFTASLRQEADGASRHPCLRGLPGTGGHAGPGACRQCLGPADRPARPLPDAGGGGRGGGRSGAEAAPRSGGGLAGDGGARRLWPGARPDRARHRRRHAGRAAPCPAGCAERGRGGPAGSHRHRDAQRQAGLARAGAERRQPGARRARPAARRGIARRGPDAAGIER
ncbi:SDR family NAD(P)-dependent oxidoreductase [Dankookia sp. P2]|uniref:SDR family NAD(P)-dependent oxidoreductase n=1 Tax=Dankookia sp. P2 TaxID=3423955 RepID=UPI003D66DD31